MTQTLQYTLGNVDRSHCPDDATLSISCRVVFVTVQYSLASYDNHHNNNCSIQKQKNWGQFIWILSSFTYFKGHVLYNTNKTIALNISIHVRLELPKSLIPVAPFTTILFFSRYRCIYWSMLNMSKPHMMIFSPCSHLTPLPTSYGYAQFLPYILMYYHSSILTFSFWLKPIFWTYFLIVQHSHP